MEIPPPEVLEVETPFMLVSITCITLAPSGYQDPPDGPDTILRNWSALAIDDVTKSDEAIKIAPEIRFIKSSKFKC